MSFPMCRFRCTYSFNTIMKLKALHKQTGQKSSKYIDTYISSYTKQEDLLAACLWSQMVAGLIHETLFLCP